MIKKSNKRRMNESYGVYDLINYFDVWGNEEDGWEVNNLSRDETDIWIDDDTTDEELVDFLIDDVGFLSPSARGKVAVWNEGDIIEFEVEETGEPLCRLERTRTADGKAMGESRTRRTAKRPVREGYALDQSELIEDMYHAKQQCEEILEKLNEFINDLEYEDVNVNSKPSAESIYSRSRNTVQSLENADVYLSDLINTYSRAKRQLGK